MAKIVINHAFLLCYVKVLKVASLYYSEGRIKTIYQLQFSVADPLSFPSITAIIITFLNELDNHSHFDSMKHSKGYISRGRK